MYEPKRGRAEQERFIRGGTTFATPGTTSEFLNVDQSAEGFAFLQREGIQTYMGGFDSAVYRAVSASHGAVDAEFVGAAAETGYLGVTTDARLVNYVQQTLMRPDIPLKVIP